MAIFVVENADVTRVYKNAAEDIIRVDTMIMEPTTNVLTTGVSARTFRRRLKTELRASLAAGRVVATIDVYTNADTVELATGNYTYVQWSNGNADTAYRCNMSDLPAVGDTV